jgi:PEP-CTERM motif
MKRIITVIVVVLAPLCLIQAQGTVYVSNLEQPSTGSDPAASDSWVAAGFQTGTNVGGYALDSIQLAMLDDSGTPNNFMVMIYGNKNDLTISPGSSLATLDGPVNPSTPGSYTYIPPSNFMLSPSTVYFIVLTSGTMVGNGAYNWSHAVANSYNPTGGWFSLGGGWTSNDGSSWNGSAAAFSQFAITATTIPEPGILFLLGLGALAFLNHHRNAWGA